jgi:serine/threonine protein kinase
MQFKTEKRKENLRLGKYLQIFFKPNVYLHRERRDEIERTKTFSISLEKLGRNSTIVEFECYLISLNTCREMFRRMNNSTMSAVRYSLIFSHSLPSPVFENREKMVLVMEFAAGGELYDYLSDRKVLTEEEARRIFRQVSTAIYYCHKHKICHRDLKLENILLDEHGNAKVSITI